MRVDLHCLLWGLDNNLTRDVAAADPYAIAMWKGLVAGAVNTAAGAALSPAAAPELAAAAAGGASGLAYAAGFTALALFGLALSLPLVLAVLFEPVRRSLDRLAACPDASPSGPARC